MHTHTRPVFCSSRQRAHGQTNANAMRKRERGRGAGDDAAEPAGTTGGVWARVWAWTRAWTFTEARAECGGRRRGWHGAGGRGRGFESGGAKREPLRAVVETAARLARLPSGLGAPSPSLAAAVAVWRGGSSPLSLRHRRFTVTASQLPPRLHLAAAASPPLHHRCCLTATGSLPRRCRLASAALPAPPRRCRLASPGIKHVYTVSGDRRRSRKCPVFRPCHAVMPFLRPRLAGMPFSSGKSRGAGSFGLRSLSLRPGSRSLPPPLLRVVSISLVLRWRRAALRCRPWRGPCSPCRRRRRRPRGRPGGGPRPGRAGAP